MSGDLHLLRRPPALPPGQTWVSGFPGFGVTGPVPLSPDDPHLCFGAAVTREAMPLSALAGLPRHTQVSDLHCVAGWSVSGLRWQGVRFADFYRREVEPYVALDRPVTYVAVQGMDGFRAVLDLRDALADDVLLADSLDSGPLGPDHGAPLRLVSPQQYGFMSVKHVCRVEAYAVEPPGRYHSDRRTQLRLTVLKPHRRARVWLEERHRHLPAQVVRPVYQAVRRHLFARRGL